MGLLDGLLGNASEADAQEINAELAEILADNEQVAHAYKMVRDLHVFTNKRLISIDKQGVTGKKVDYLSIPYKSITQFNVQTSGHFDTDCELKVWVSGQSQALEIEIKSALAADVQKTLANMMFA
ncbi:PH domain-containing protein [Glaciecola sp. 2405UD65-10]|uniref:PH domain-containing protein n=1 Tax=Glaciecola sp. 2405UD65-10 TaxID=3397244 RepID=UPI003B5B01F2